METKEVIIEQIQWIHDSLLRAPRSMSNIIPTNKITQMKLAHKLVTLQLLNSCVFFTAGVHARGDFMVHLARLDDKKKWIRQVL
jgi:hypothetical protein